jgi:leucyl aminopeptidase
MPIISFKSYTDSINFNSQAYCFLFSNSDDLKIDQLKLPSFFTEKDLNIFLKNNNFNGKEKQLLALPFIHENEIKHLIFAGVGNKNSNFPGKMEENIRFSIGNIIRYIEKNKINSVFFDSINLEIEEKKLSKIISSSVLISAYEFNKYITDKNRLIHSNYSCFILGNENLKDFYIKGIEEGCIIGNAVNNCRNWCDLPPCDIYPKSFADEANKLLSKHENIKIDILNKKKLESLGMGGILGVCQGSIHEPILFIAEYIPKSYEKTIALVGKGVTFDTGGISIKPSDNMDDMKDDMAGGAVVISSLDALAKLNSPYRIIIAVPMVENMPSGTAIKPGDILTHYNKKTSEILNTDAEGRLILADALSYISENYKPDYMIDFATLTGACAVALGPIFAAVMGKHNNLIDIIKNAGLESGDRCWELPLDDGYSNAVESNLADVRNTGKAGYKAGTITAGWFLKNFVPDEINWAHIDIASMSMHPINKPYLRNTGATGFGVKLCIEMISNNKYF